MASDPQAVATGEEFKLTAPAPVPQLAPERAAGLVPVSDDVKSKLETRVEAFVGDLAAQDANSPEFGKYVDQITNLGRKEIAEAAGQSNRFLDRPVRAMDDTTGVGADLAALRRTIEELDPSTKGNLLSKKRFLGVIPFGNKMRDYFESYQSAQSHIGRSSRAFRAARTSC